MFSAILTSQIEVCTAIRQQTKKEVIRQQKKNLEKAIQNLEEAKKKEPENNKLWYLLSVAHGKNSEMGESRYASAYSFYLKGDDAMALSFIERAKKITKRNSSTWAKLINLENKINLKKK